MLFAGTKIVIVELIKSTEDFFIPDPVNHFAWDGNADTQTINGKHFDVRVNCVENLLDYFALDLMNNELQWHT